MDNEKLFIAMLDDLSKTYKTKTRFGTLERLFSIILDRFCGFYVDFNGINFTQEGGNIIVSTIIKTGPNPIWDIKDFQYKLTNIDEKDFYKSLLNILNLFRKDLYSQNMIIDFTNFDIDRAFIKLIDLNDDSFNVIFNIDNKSYIFTVDKTMSDLTLAIKNNFKG